MRTRFVVGLGMALLLLGTETPALAQVGNHIAGFDIRWIREYEPSKEDGVSMVGEPDWNAELELKLAAESAAKAQAAAESESEAGEALPEAAQEEEEALEADGEWVSLGDDWVITYYCPLSCCNDQWAWKTSTQEPMQLHHTIAVDPSVIPYYTHVRIGGLDYEYVAEDCGGGIKGKRIDVLVDNCSIANKMGVDRNVEVWVKK